MRRDLIIGLLVSLAIHGGVAGISEWMDSGPPVQAVVEEPQLIELMQMPEIEPEPEEIYEMDDSAPVEVAEFAPPTQVDTPQVVQIDSFVQPVQPPPPEGVRMDASAISIPQGRVSGFGGRGVEIFDISKLDQQPVARFQAQPAYPFEMRRAGITGQVIVGFIVDSNGDVRDAHVIQSTQREFDSAALQAVARWKFRPGRKGGRAVNTRMQVPIVFSITED